jgi:hypothetical protein
MSSNNQDVPKVEKSANITPELNNEEVGIVKVKESVNRKPISMDTPVKELEELLRIEQKRQAAEVVGKYMVLAAQALHMVVEKYPFYTTFNTVQPGAKSSATDSSPNEKQNAEQN